MTGWPNDRGIYLQLQRLADFITTTRQELAALRPGEVKQQFLSKATDELDAIVESTSSATHRIMDAADSLMDLAGELDEKASGKVMEAATSIYEACSFQDITGQRVTKIVGMLKVIEERIDKMVDAMDGKKSASPDVSEEPEAPPAPAHQGSTLEGPALPGLGTSQSDIDKILAGG